MMRLKRSAGGKKHALSRYLPWLGEGREGRGSEMSFLEKVCSAEAEAEVAYQVWTPRGSGLGSVGSFGGGRGGRCDVRSCEREGYGISMRLESYVVGDMPLVGITGGG